MPTRTPVRKTKTTKRPLKNAKKLAKKLLKEKSIGVVVHYYDRLGVAIVKLSSPLKVGEIIRLQRGNLELLQVVSSLQIDHRNVERAKRGDVVGLKVSAAVAEGTKVLPAV